MAKEFQYAEGRRVKITNAQRKQIRQMYRRVAKEIASTAKQLKGRENISSVLRQAYLDDLLTQVEGNIETLNEELEGTIRSNMLKASTAVVKDNARYLQRIGIGLVQAYSYVPKDIIEEVVTGKIYKGRWTLSKAIWSDSKKTIADLHTIIAKGIAENKSAYAIAKELEKYVDPSVRKDWSWSKVYPGTKKIIDYSAQRLARTMVSHAYQESFVRTTKYNPFIDSYQWLISNSDRVCPLCIDRATLDQYGLGKGIFPKNALPLDHPNGMCTFSIVRSRSYEQISNDLVNWVTRTGDEQLNKQIDIFAYDLSNRHTQSVKMLKKSLTS